MAVERTARTDRTTSSPATGSAQSKVLITPKKEASNASPLSLERFKAEITKRAEEVYKKRQQSNMSGDALSDWLTAEREVKAKHHLS